MILYVVLSGLYLIGAVGYYKLSKKVIAKDSDGADILKDLPVISKLAMAFLASIWFIVMYLNLVKEAAQPNES